MTSLQAFQFLVTAAKVDQKLKQTFSRIEITKKLNEIKYLSAQKKVPKLSLRKEILHLEHKVNRILEVEERIKEQDSVKINALKKEVAGLRKKLSVAVDKDMAKRVDKLVHLLGESLAKRGVARELLPQAVITTSETESMTTSRTVRSRVQRARLLRTKLEALKRQLEIMQQLEKDPQKLQELQQQMQQWERQLQMFLRKHPEARNMVGDGNTIEDDNMVEDENGVAEGNRMRMNEEISGNEITAANAPPVKHTLMFEPRELPEGKADTEIDNVTKELFPVPPPPKVKKKEE